MFIFGYFHLFPPEHNAGSETTVHAALRAMVNRGHRVDVVCDRSATAPYTIDGIEVIRPPRRGRQRWMIDAVKDADLLVTHLDLTSQAMQLARDVNKPLVHFIHNSMQLKYWHVNTLKCQLAVFNSHWIAEAEQWVGPQIIIHPVVEPEYYRCERGESITLVNPTSGKGQGTFYELARRMPERTFITAQGGYGYQVSCPTPKTTGRDHVNHPFYDETGCEQNCFGLPNVTHLKNDPDIRNVFRRTKVLLMPSDYESYGRVGVEAASVGIPTIAHPTPGLKEAFGNAAIFCDREDVDSWEKEIDRLFTDEIYYRKRSSNALALADSLEPESEFDRLEEAFLGTVERWQNKESDKIMKTWTSDRKIFRTRNGQLVGSTDGSIPPDAQSLVAGPGGRISEEDAIKYGFMSRPAETTEVLLDTKALTGPPENKAIEAPEENKSIDIPKRRGRPKKVA